MSDLQRLMTALAQLAPIYPITGMYYLYFVRIYVLISDLLLNEDAQLNHIERARTSMEGN